MAASTSFIVSSQGGFGRCLATGINAHPSAANWQFCADDRSYKAGAMGDEPVCNWTITHDANVLIQAAEGQPRRHVGLPRSRLSQGRTFGSRVIHFGLAYRVQTGLRFCQVWVRY